MCCCKQSTLLHCCAAQGSFCLLFSPSDLVTALLCGPWRLVSQLPAHQGPQEAGTRAAVSKWISGKRLATSLAQNGQGAMLSQNLS